MTDDERTAALRFDPDAFALAQQRVKSDPTALTDADFVQLHIISPTLASDAYEARRLAQLAVVAQHSTPVVQTKAAKLPAPETKEEWLQRYGKKLVSGALLFKVTEDLTDTLVDILMNHKAKLATLEQANKDLSSRLLELEAREAAHVDR